MDIYDGLSDAEATEMTENIARYNAALHAVQSGVMYEMEYTNSEAHTPKHLRVGVNSALVTNGALVTLLVSKGLITFPEWFSSLADMMEEEVVRYEEATGGKFL